MKRLNYFGTRSSFVETLKNEFHGLVESNQLSIHQGQLDELDEYTFKEHEESSVIILDISPLDELLAPKICPSLLMLKEEEQLEKTKIILTSGKPPSLELQGLYHSCGVQYFFVWGGDEKLFRRNILELLDQNPPDNSDFATLRNIDTPIMAWFPASFNKISSKVATIESPLDLPIGEKLVIEGRLVKDLGLQKITLRKKSSESDNLYYPNKFEMIPPIVNDYGHITKNDLYGEKISRQHFERIIKTHGTQFIQKMNTIGVFGPNRQMKRISKLLNLESCSEVLWFKNFTEDKAKLKEILPDLLFLNIDDEADLSDKEENAEVNNGKNKEDFGFKFEEIPQLIQVVKGQSNYDPIIIILNSPSHSLALKQVFQYDKLMAFQQKMTREVLLGIIDKYNNWMSAPLTFSSPQFVKVESSDRIFWLEKEIILHTLNEDYIEFFYNGEITPYTWMTIECPEKLSVVILPTLINKTGPSGEKAFKARIMGLQGMLESYLRVFVNQCYDNPQESFQDIENIKKRVYKSLEEVEGYVDPNHPMNLKKEVV